MIKKFFAVCLSLLPIFAFANTANWQIVPKESSLTFTATQNGAPVSGKFAEFSGDIYFDPAQLKSSHVQIVIKTTSVTTDYGDIAVTLKTADWFDTSQFPEAVFTSSDFISMGAKSYQAKGMLTIRGISVPAVVQFSLDEFTASTAAVTGSIPLKRLDFGVGQGEWAKTDNVKNDVKVQFVIHAVKK